jgi:predicted  nucleic acid-binding Zn-ribbon protein
LAAIIMADRLDKLRATLSELDAELRSIDSLDDPTREELAEAAAEIAASLRRGKRSEKTQMAADSLQNRVVEFEAANPQLAGIVSRLLDGLAQLGI